METTEKGMKIVVTRAPRIRKANYADLPAESYYMRQLATFGPDRVFRYELGMKDVPSRRVDIQFVLPYDVGLGHASTGNAVVPFDSFDHMCQWVANGRKLEDLGGDLKDEVIFADSMPLSSYATVAEDYGSLAAGDVVVRSEDPNRAVQSLLTGKVYSFHSLGPGQSLRVIPIDLERGDTITITCK